MGIMGGKNKISNAKLKGTEFLVLKKILIQHFKIEHIKQILLVTEGKCVFEVVVNTNNSYRLDVYDLDNKPKTLEFYRRRMRYQTIANNAGVNIPKVLGFFKDIEFIYKLSEWIKGDRVGHVWNLQDMFQKAGIEVAKINLLKDPNSNRFLGYNDFSKPNAIWTKDKQIYLVDVIVEPKRDVDASVLKILNKNLDSDPKRCGWFLEGYETVRRTADIRKMFM